ncbi:MAG TPA: nucleoside/nucleotide kinase family protein [Pseudonocardiaceae bacterium]|nr:nucleoside/nucleotide kinase family protein [Pseudonocardiaceae bacterium]
MVPGERRLLGLAGAPGAGKSTLAIALCAALGPAAARVPMDGFHLANQVLAGLGLADRKGSPPTFDAGGFQALLRRLRAADEDVVYAPEFYRDLEEPIAGALPVARDVALVVVEGNYLLLDDGPWCGTADLFDEVWFLRPDDTARRRRLVLRHESYGRSPDEAEFWVSHNDDPNAEVVAGTAGRADVVVSPES